MRPTDVTGRTAWKTATRGAMGLAVLLVTAAGAAAQSPSDSAAIAAASRAFSEAYVAGDTAAIRGLYTDDAVLLPPGRTLRGPEAAARWFAPRQGRTTIEHAMVPDEIRITGDVAVDIGTWRNTWRVGDQAPRSASGGYLVVWRRGVDGRWRIEYDMWHSGN